MYKIQLPYVCDPMAMKEIRLTDKRTEDLAEREIACHSTCASPNVVDYFTSHKDDETVEKERISTYCILMEFCEGGSLQDFMDSRTQPLPLEEIKSLCRNIFQGLQFVHRYIIDNFCYSLRLII